MRPLLALQSILLSFCVVAGCQSAGDSGSGLPGTRLSFQGTAYAATSSTTSSTGSSEATTTSNSSALTDAVGLGSGFSITNLDSTDGNLSTLDLRSVDQNGNRYTGARIAGVHQRHLPGYLWSDIAFLARYGGTKLTETMRVTGYGRVGIGTKSPIGKLDVVGGDAYFNGVRVGIGGGSIPSNLVVASDNGLSSNLTGAGNTVVGNAALVSNTTGDSNLAFGNFAMRFNQVGSNNIGIGSQSLYLNDSGSLNTSVGHNSLQYNSVGQQNVAVGGYALRSNDVGNFNTSVGTQTMLANISGMANTALGFDALQSNSVGHKNVAIGGEALVHNTTASYNTGLGYQAADGNTTGERNTAVGASALYLQQEGSDNTAVGRFAANGGGNFSASGLTAIGTGALASIRSGADSNTALGYRSGYGLITGSANTLLGYLSDVSDESDRNSIVIGANATGAGSNTVTLGNNDIAKTLLKGSVGIGTSSPTSKLHIMGLPAYPNNASALAGGLTPGALYRTGNDPDLLAIVH